MTNPYTTPQFPFPPQPPKKKMGTGKKVGIGLAAGIVALIAVNAGGGDSDTISGTATPEVPTEVVVVDAATLLAEFEGNEVQADAKYKGKYLEVTGVVDGVDAEAFDDEAYVLRVGDGSEFVLITVNCYGIPADKLANVNIGDTVTMVGEFSDGGGLSVRLEGCTLR